jgi:Flp pilus assembly protein TadD
MNSLPKRGRQVLLAAVFGWLAVGTGPARALAAMVAQTTNEIRIVKLEGTAEISPPGSTRWILTQTNQILKPFDRLRTGPNSRATLLWSDQSVVSFDALTEMEILPPDAPEAHFGLNFIKGILSFFHRDKPGRIRVITRGALAGVEGTEFVLAVDVTNNTERTTLSLIDGKVRFSNEQGTLVLTNGQQAIADLGRRPVLTAGFIANNLLQWCFYYPAVLDLRDLPFGPGEQSILAESLSAYRAGDLLAALTKYPAGRKPSSDAERIYYAALLLSVGRVEQTETLLAGLPAADAAKPLPRLSGALRRLIAAVKLQPNPSTLNPQLSTELLAASYYEQSQAARDVSLRKALDLARQAATNSPEFGFAWARVAELEFSFGHTGSALDALSKSLALAPRNAQALALKGFLLAAQNKTREGIEVFNEAIAIDSALGNAWLGRGLCRIRRGDEVGGREDLLIAAALEPQRAILRSYLGKAYANEGDFSRAGKELQLAKDLDLNDPTAWLYSALLKQQQNRINEAISDLEKSQELNENRSIYRSRLLLDQDQAVRSANLAAIYRDAGMTDVSVREASRAVSYDYANYSAHLFLANSYDQLRDPNRINLRYETPAESEYLIANLLAPVGAGTLAQSISQQEYSKLFERDRFGISSSTEYLSRGAWIEKGAQFGTFGNRSYAFEGLYRSDPGQRPNNDFEETELRLHLKQQITPQDTVYLRAISYEAEGGDVIQYFDPATFNAGLRTKESHEPNLSFGYHHQWAPGVETLLLGTLLHDRLSVANPTQPTLFIIKEDGVTPSYVQPIAINLRYQTKPEIHAAELQQIFQQSEHTTVLGGRFQGGNFHTRDRETDPAAGDNVVFFDPNAPAALQDFRVAFERLSLYGYQRWQVFNRLELIGGLSYDRLTFPEDFRAPPISNRQERLDQWSPKAGFIWNAARNTIARFAYTRSIGGASSDQSFILEPSQVAGINQSFRSILPESIGGAEAGARFETFGVSLEQKCGTGTYIGLSGQILDSKVRRKFGVFEYTGATDFAVPGLTPEHIDYDEKTLQFSLDQLIGAKGSLGAVYRLSRAQLHDNFVEIPNTAFSADDFHPRQKLESTLNELNLFALYYHPNGFFSQIQALWYLQSNKGYSPDRPGDDFWQFNVFAGYRFPGRKAEVRLGLLNLADQDYRLNPLTLYNDLPRKRTFTVRLEFNF